MCGRSSGHLVKADGEIVCVVCGWRSYRIQSPRATRLCRNCELPAVTRDYCAGHRAAHNAQRRARRAGLARREIDAAVDVDHLR